MQYHRDRVALTEGAVDRLFAQRITDGRAPGGAYVVFDTGRTVYGNGFGDQGAGQRPTPDTAFRIASCSKSFTAAALLILVERGLVDLDAPIDTVLSVGPLTGPYGEQVAPPTLRQLVSMAGGLPSDDPWADRQESLPADDFTALVARGMRFIHSPGQQYEYSNLGFALLGAVIEKISGTGFVEFVTTELITPLGLDGIGFDQRVSAPSGVATGYARVDDSWKAQPFTAPGAFSAIGGVVATPRALARWAGWLSATSDESDEPGDRNQPLSRASRLLMQSLQTPNPSAGLDLEGYGMGLVIDEDPRHGTVISHKGGYPGFGAHMRWHLGSGIGVLALENGRYSTPYLTCRQALKLILDETTAPASEPQVWPEVLKARRSMERLLRSWDPSLAAEIFADNVDLDEPLERRAADIAALVEEVQPAAEPLALVDSAPDSRSPAHLAWTVPGRNGSLRCEITLTPTEPPMIQTCKVRRG